jgi:hemerythrin superfamily protein
MPTSRAASRASSQARTEVLAELKDDHKRVKKAYRDFQKLDGEEDVEACEALVRQVLDELTVHAAIEEELLYPAARGAIADEHLLDEAEVEHESMHALIDQLRGMSADDEKYAARFTVLCEYVLHHVKEEEGEMFPQLEKARLDWSALAAEMAQRREELTPAAVLEEGDDSSEDGPRGSHSAAGQR